MAYPFEPYKIDTYFNKPTFYGTHEGIDLNLPSGGNTDCGLDLKAIKSGIVVNVSSSTGNYGKLLVIQVDSGNVSYFVRYAHCQEILVKRGDRVSEGQVVAKMGSTGNSTACHLHLDVLKKHPPHWRYYTQNVTEWFVDPLWFIKNVDGGHMSDDSDTQLINIEGVGEVTADLEGLKKVDEFLQEERQRLVDEKKKVEKLSVAAARYAEFEKMGFTNPKEVETAFETVKEERDKERATNAQTAREYKDAYKDLVRDLANALGSSQQPPEIMDAVRKALKAESEWASKEKQYKADRKEWMDNEMKLKDEIARLQARLEGEQDPNLEEILKMLIKRLRKLVIERRPV